jgi:flagellar protein FlbD
MIKLTRLDGEQFVLNADLIRYVESRPDTFVTLVSGERLVVCESMDEVVARTVRYQQLKYLSPLGIRQLATRQVTGKIHYTEPE